jgi:hypothetical protein
VLGALLSVTLGGHRKRKRRDVQKIDASDGEENREHHSILQNEEGSCGKDSSSQTVAEIVTHSD